MADAGRRHRHERCITVGQPALRGRRRAALSHPVGAHARQSRRESGRGAVVDAAFPEYTRPGDQDHPRLQRKEQNRPRRPEIGDTRNRAADGGRPRIWRRKFRETRPTDRQFRAPRRHGGVSVGRRDHQPFHVAAVSVSRTRARGRAHGPQLLRRAWRPRYLPRHVGGRQIPRRKSKVVCRVRRCA